MPSVCLDDSSQPFQESNDVEKGDSDAYISLMLADYLDHQANLPSLDQSLDQPLDQPLGHPLDPPSASTESLLLDQAQLGGILWVPAHKHPQIAPSEFTQWIKSHPTHPTRHTSLVKRRKSSLSQSHTSEEEEGEREGQSHRHNANRKGRLTFIKENTQHEVNSVIMEEIDTDSLYSQSTLVDLPIVVPNEKRSLLRRSAFSARGRSRKDIADREHSLARRSMTQRLPSSKNAIFPEQDIHLYDRPVSLSEWIDLGSASLASTIPQHGILSRVHDVETQVFSQWKETLEDQVESLSVIDEFNSKTEIHQPSTPTISHLTTLPDTPTVSTPIVSTPTVSTPTVSTPSTSTVSTPPTLPPTKHRNSERTKTKQEKKSSWLVGLFHDKDKRHRLQTTPNTSPTHPLESKTQPTTYNEQDEKSVSKSPSKRSTGIASFFHRSLSIKPKQEIKLTESKKKKHTPAMEKIPPQCINSYRLPLNVERAVYRLSHHKLENPRRPLRHQVLISNFMFWYLFIINRQNSPNSGPTHLSDPSVPYYPDKNAVQFHRKGRMGSPKRKRRDGQKVQHPPKQEKTQLTKSGYSSQSSEEEEEEENEEEEEEEEEEENEDNIPLSYYKH